MEPHLLSLPDTVLVHVFHLLDDVHSLGRLCMSAAAIDVCLSSAQAQALWRHWCDVYRVSSGSTGGAKTAFARHARQICTDCRAQQTRYVFALLGHRRLCEGCERASPHRYGLATKEQLHHERSIVGQLSACDQRAVFARLPSLQLAGHAWFLRAATTAAAAEHLQRAQAAEADLEAGTGEEAETEGERCEARTTPFTAVVQAGDGDATAEASGESIGSGVGAASALDSVASEWDAAARSHAARRRPDAVVRAEQKAEQKAHKRRVKAEQRERRERQMGALLPASCASPRGVAAPGSSHKPRRPSARDHRVAAQPDAWERTLEALEATFGEGLAGLSGLVLANDDECLKVKDATLRHKLP